MSERERTSGAETRVVATPVVATVRREVERTRRTAQVVLGLLFILGIVGLFYWGREALPPFLLGLIVAYMLLPPVRRLERMLPYGGFWQKARRPLAALVVSVITLVAISFLLRGLAEPVIEQTSQILGSIFAFIAVPLFVIYSWSTSRRSPARFVRGSRAPGRATPSPWCTSSTASLAPIPAG